MIILKADAAVKAVFHKTISVMGSDIGWNEVFVISNNAMLLPGDKRTIVFSFDNHKVASTVADFNVNEDNARLMLDNKMLENILNITLYIFGKWGQIKGLTVEKNYEQLNMLINNVLYDIKAEAEIAFDKCRFYKDGKQITYEDVVELMLKEISYLNNEDEDEQESEDGNKGDEENSENSDDESGDLSDSDEDTNEKESDVRDEEYRIGIWHKIIWKSKDKKFEKSDISNEKRKKSRLGKGFYISEYKCPVCGENMYVIVFPVGDEFRIETDERPVLLARAYTCSKCLSFYTARPYKMLLDGQVYVMEFDGDKSAYEDYVELLGEKGKKTSNCNYNVYADEKEGDPDEGGTQKNDNGTDFAVNSAGNDNAASDETGKRKWDNTISTDENIIYSDKKTKDYNAKRNNAPDLNKEYFPKNKTGSDKKYVSDNSKEIKKNISGKTDIKTSSSYEVKESKNKDRKEEKAVSYLNNGNFNAFEREISDMPVEQLKHLAKTVENKSVSNEDPDRQNYEENMRKGSEILQRTILKKQKENLLRQASDAKNISYGEIVSNIEQIRHDDSPWEMKEPVLKILDEYRKKRGAMELESVKKAIPEGVSRQQFEQISEKIRQYDNDDDLDKNVVDQIKSKLSDSRSKAEKKEIAAFIKKYNPRKSNRKSVLNAYEGLKKQNFSEDNVKPFLDKLHDNLYDIDKKRIEQICPEPENMSFDECEDAYKKISEGDFLPELKVDMLARIDKRLISMKKDENIHLVRKFSKDTGVTKDSFDDVYLYDIVRMSKDSNNDEDIIIVRNALNTYMVSKSKYEFPIMIYDNSKSGNASKGFAITPDNIYYRYHMNDGVLKISDIKEIYTDSSLLSKGVFVDYKNVGKVKIAGLSKNGKNEFGNFIDKVNTFIRYLKEKPKSRNIDYMVHEKHAVKCCYRCGYVYKGDVCPKCGYRNN